MNKVLALVLLVMTTGCTDAKWCEIRQPAESPRANLPRPLRQENWRSPSGSGSCVIASTCSLLQWHNQERLAQTFRRSYSGGQTADSIKQIWSKHRIPFETEENGKPDFLEWCSNNRSAALIWFFPSHCVTFCGFGRSSGRQVAWLLDNNRVGQFIPVEKNEFIRAWRGFGGFAMATTLPPVPQVPFDGYAMASR